MSSARRTIAEEYNCSYETVRRWLEPKRRSSQIINASRNAKRRYQSLDQIIDYKKYQKYYNATKKNISTYAEELAREDTHTDVYAVQKYILNKTNIKFGIRILYRELETRLSKKI